jgi:hypothetical protein
MRQHLLEWGMKTAQALNLIPLTAALVTGAGCASGRITSGTTTGVPTHDPLSNYSFGSQPVRNLVSVPNHPSTSASTPVGIRVATLEEARSYGPKFFGYVQLENGQIAYALRDRYDSKALSPEERDRLNKFERQLDSMEKREGNSARSLARQKGKVTGDVLALDGRAAAKSAGKAYGKSGVLAIDESQRLRYAAQLEQYKVAIGVQAPAGVTNTVLLKFLK